jgi:hypothetical protein
VKREKNDSTGVVDKDKYIYTFPFCVLFGLLQYQERPFRTGAFLKCKDENDFLHVECKKGKFLKI